MVKTQLKIGAKHRGVKLVQIMWDHKGFTYVFLHTFGYSMQLLTILFFQFLFILSGNNLHDYHVIISKIKLKESQMQITHKVFYDDLEKAILQTYNQEVEVDKPLSSTDIEWIKKYFNANFTLTINGKKTELNWVGQELDNELFYVYCSLEKVKRIKSLSIENQLLINTFEDQSNIVHTQLNGERNSFFFRSGKTQQLQTLE